MPIGANRMAVQVIPVILYHLPQRKSVVVVVVCCSVGTKTLLSLPWVKDDAHIRTS